MFTLDDIKNADFIYQHDNRRIACSLPDVWIEDCGVMQERGRAFVLHLKGKRIGFREPDCREERDRGRGDGSYTNTIGDIGSAVHSWSEARNEIVEAAGPKRFKSRSEQDLVVEIIRSAMSTYKGTWHERDLPAIHVTFTQDLIDRLSSGALIDE